MKKENIVYFFIVYMLAICIITVLLSTFASGCSPAAIRISEEVIEDVVEEELKGK